MLWDRERSFPVAVIGAMSHPALDMIWLDTCKGFLENVAQWNF